jgi:hypothetical protein
MYCIFRSVSSPSDSCEPEKKRRRTSANEIAVVSQTPNLEANSIVAGSSKNWCQGDQNQSRSHE